MLVIDVEVLVVLDGVVRPSPSRCLAVLITRGVVDVDTRVMGVKPSTIITEGGWPDRFFASVECIVASFWKSLSSTSEKQQLDMARVFGA